MSYGIALTLDLPFDDVVAEVRGALADQGFGIVTEIDMQATLKAKLGEDMERYLILGACNPPLAHKALQAEPDIGLLLPCNVVVRQEADDRITVGFIDPQIMVDLIDKPEVREVADDAKMRLQRARDSLAG